MSTYPVKTIAKLLDLTERRVQQLAKEGVIPKEANGRYDLVQAVRGYVKYLRDRSLGQGAGPDAQAERARLTKLKADREEITLSNLRGEMVLVVEAVALLEKVIMACRSKILAIPTRAAPLVVRKRKTAEVRDVLTRVTDEVLHELSVIDPSTLGDSIGGQGKTPALATAAQVDGESVGGPRKAVKPGE